MIVKGSARAAARELTRHLLRVDSNERVEVVELRGVAADRLGGALKEMEAIAAGSRCRAPLYHASLNTEREAQLSPEQWLEAVERLETGLGLSGHQRAIVLHRKADRDHVHVVWNRVDTETLKAAHMGWSYRTHELVARELERDFGLRPVQGVHAERAAEVPRPERTPASWEMQQAERTKIPVREAEAVLSATWAQADSGPGFAAALEAQGWQLARGDSRDFIAVDPAGGAHSLGRRVIVDGRKLGVAAVRERLGDIDLDELPDASEARARLQYRQLEAARPEREPAPDSAQHEVRKKAPATARSGAERDTTEAEEATRRRRQWRLLEERQRLELQDVDTGRTARARAQQAATRAEELTRLERDQLRLQEERHEAERAALHGAQEDVQRQGPLGKLWQGVKRLTGTGTAPTDPAQREARARQRETQEAERQALVERHRRQREDERKRLELLADGERAAMLKRHARERERLEKGLSRQQMEKEIARDKARGRGDSDGGRML